METTHSTSYKDTEELVSLLRQRYKDDDLVLSYLKVVLSCVPKHMIDCHIKATQTAIIMDSLRK